MKVYEVYLRLSSEHFANYLGDCVYDSKEKADEEVNRLLNTCMKECKYVGKVKAKDHLNNNGRSVRIVNKDDEYEIYEWFGYRELNVI